MNEKLLTWAACDLAATFTWFGVGWFSRRYFDVRQVDNRLEEQKAHYRQQFDDLLAEKSRLCDELQDSIDRLNESRDEMVNSLAAARTANRELRQGWDLTCRELREALKDNASIQQQVTLLSNTLLRSDQVKKISETRIGELEAEVASNEVWRSEFTAASFDLKAAQDSLIQGLEEESKSIAEQLNLNRANTQCLEHQISDYARKLLDERHKNEEMFGLMRDRASRIEELENALQTIKGCIEDQMIEAFVETPS